MPIWGKIELLCRAISEAGESEAEKILGEARAEAERLLAEARGQAESEFDRDLLSQKSSAYAEAKRLVDSAELEARKRIITCRERIMQEILATLETRLQDARKEPVHAEFLLSSINEGLGYLPGAEFIVEINPQDLERVTAGVENLAGRRAVRIVVNTSPLIEGGVRITTSDRRLLFDNTLATRLKRHEEVIRQKIWKRILGIDKASRGAAQE